MICSVQCDSNSLLHAHAHIHIHTHTHTYTHILTYVHHINIYIYIYSTQSHRHPKSLWTPQSQIPFSASGTYVCMCMCTCASMCVYICIAKHLRQYTLPRLHDTLSTRTHYTHTLTVPRVSKYHRCRVCDEGTGDDCALQVSVSVSVIE
jgi:hypothetical protein